MDTAALTSSPAAAPVPGPSMWPIVAALGGVLVVVGLVTYPVVFVFGILALLAAAVEWMVQAWSERASADVLFNDSVRSRIAHPLEFPILAALGAGILVYSFSRIMLFLSKSTGPAVFAAIAALILAAGFVVAFRPTLRTGAVGVVCVVAALGLVTGGVSAALEGERELEPHETTGQLAEDGECDTPEETEADEHASQNVAAKANLTAEVTLQRRRHARRPQPRRRRRPADRRRHAGEPDECAVHQRERARSAASSSTSARGPSVDEATGDTIPDTEVPAQICTQLVEEGGSQLLTFSIPTPSAPRRRRRTGSSCRASTVPRSRSSYHERRAPPPPARTRSGCDRRRRVRQRRAAGHVAAGRRERPEDPGPAVAGVRPRRPRRADRRRRHRLGRLPVPRPRPADPQADPRAPGAGDRPDDPAGGHPHRHRHPDRRHADGPVQDGRHRVLRQRHRPAVVVGGRLPDAGGLRRHRDADRHERADGHPDGDQRARARHQSRRHPQLVDPQAQRQARHGPGSRPHGPAAGRRAGHLRRSVHRVLRALPRQHAHGGRRPRSRPTSRRGRPTSWRPTRRPRRARWRPPAKRPSSPSARAATRSTACSTPTATR